MSACVIDMGYDGDGWRVYHAEPRRARREHACVECGRPIRHGERYEHAWGVSDDGESVAYKTCGSCASVRDVLFCSFFHGMLWEEIERSVREEWAPYDAAPWATLARLPRPARDRILEMIENAWNAREEAES